MGAKGPFKLCGGHLALDHVNTLDWRLADEPVERLVSQTELLAWLRQVGLIDAAEFNNPTSDRDFGMQDVSKHYHLASFHQSQEFFECTFNKATLASGGTVQVSKTADGKTKLTLDLGVADAVILRL